MHVNTSSHRWISKISDSTKSILVLSLVGLYSCIRSRFCHLCMRCKDYTLARIVANLSKEAPFSFSFWGNTCTLKIQIHIYVGCSHCIVPVPAPVAGRPNNSTKLQNYITENDDLARAAYNGRLGRVLPKCTYMACRSFPRAEYKWLT
jgi:hypothetical protein